MGEKGAERRHYDMPFTIKIQKSGDDKFRASLEELPTIFYEGKSASEAADRMQRLLNALRSPHIHVDHIRKDGDVVLRLDRRAEYELAELEDESKDSVVHQLYSTQPYSSLT
jgi:Uri superfamily endonuclease